jgi:hypothetical protein
MKPILAGLLEGDGLTDEFGNALEDLSRFNFAKPIEKMVDDLIRKLDELIDKFGDVGGAAPGLHTPGSAGTSGMSRASASPSYEVAARASLARAASSVPVAAARGVGVTVNIQAWDGASVDAWLRKGGGDRITRAVVTRPQS